MPNPRRRDTSNPPEQITNTIGEVYLRKGDLTDVDRKWSLGIRGCCLICISDPLASNFSILLGRIEIQVPDVEPDNDYRIVCK
jgi:hypothetical protein